MDAARMRIHRALCWQARNRAPQPPIPVLEPAELPAEAGLHRAATELCGALSRALPRRSGRRPL